ncbi:MAG: DUF1826 domain-containing protein [Myxococcota bacterium]
MIVTTSPHNAVADAARQPDVLEQLLSAQVNLVSWHRELASGLDEQLVEWAGCFPAQFSEVVSLPDYDLSAAMHGLKEPARTWLATDISILLSRFATFVDASRLSVRFGAIRTDQCRKFHVDNVRYRLITTYVGPGTQWVPDNAVHRGALSRPSKDPNDANTKIVEHASAIRQAKAGDVLVMKGERHTNQSGAVHRSPPIECSGDIRVVLVVTTVDD